MAATGRTIAMGAGPAEALHGPAAARRRPALLRWEGAPDAPFFRAQLWSYLVELPEGARTAAEDEASRFLVDVTVPRGVLSAEGTAGLVEEATRIVLSAAGPSQADAPRVWVLVHEQPEGTGGRADGSSATPT
jgi:phenylpyruvate tautomerase PptA (4-oxalocrotonate tautomerase family)